ncbi:MAG: PorT family protein [Chitinophagales bacterium]|nr:PorT family protein [Chitinophagales bacterium]
MKNLTAFLLILLIIPFSYGQDKVDVKSKRFQIGINISPDICYRTLANNNNSASSDAVIKSRNSYETVKPGLTGGLNVRYFLNKKFGLETGFQYSIKGFQTEWKTGIPIDPPDLPYKFKFVDDFHYLEVPIKANYTIYNSKVRLFISGGVSTGFMLEKKDYVVYKYDDRTVRNYQKDNYEYNKINITPTIGLGAEYTFKNNSHIVVEPTFRHGISKTTDTPVTAYLYSFGLNLGYYFGL